MSGEASKEIGDLGERVVSKLLTLMGWLPFSSNFDITCHKPMEHERPSKKHGIDFLKKYKCPMVSLSQKNIIISSKYYSNYENDPSKKTKQFLIDLGRAMTCLRLDSKYGREKIDNTVNQITVRGALFYLSHAEDDNYSILPDLSKFRNTDGITYDPVYLIDNKTATFLYSAITDCRATNARKRITYSIPKTDLNILSYDKSSTSDFLPLELITSQMIPFCVEIGTTRELHLYVNDSFSEESISKIAGFCQDYTSGWASKMTVYFPDYHELEHAKIVEAVFSLFGDTSLVTKTAVRSFSRKSFKRLEEENE